MQRYLLLRSLLATAVIVLALGPQPSHGNFFKKMSATVGRHTGNLGQQASKTWNHAKDKVSKPFRDAGDEIKKQAEAAGRSIKRFFHGDPDPSFDAPNHPTVGASEAALANVRASAPAQSESWSCGPHSLYRSLLLQGRSLPSMEDFLSACPTTIKGTIGPKPKELMRYAQRYVSSANHERDAKRDFRTFVDALLSSLTIGAPPVILVQLRDDQTSKIAGFIDALHYMTVVRWDKERGLWRVMDTDNSIKLWNTRKLYDMTRISSPFIEGADGLFFGAKRRGHHHAVVF